MTNHVRSLKSTSLMGIAKQIARKFEVAINLYTYLDDGNLEFDSDKSCVFVRNISIDDFLVRERTAFDGCSYAAIMKTIKSLFRMEELSEFDDDAIFVIFCILHECGHYLSRKDDSLHSEAAEQTYKTKREVMKVMYGLNSIDYHLRYRELPQEADADKFAQSKLLETLNLFTSK